LNQEGDGVTGMLLGGFVVIADVGIFVGGGFTVSASDRESGFPNLA